MLEPAVVQRALREHVRNAWPRASLQWLAVTPDFGTVLVSTGPGEAEQMIHIDWSRYSDVGELADDVLGAFV